MSLFFIRYDLLIFVDVLETNAFQIGSAQTFPTVRVTVCWQTRANSCENQELVTGTWGGPMIPGLHFNHPCYLDDPVGGMQRFKLVACGSALISFHALYMISKTFGVHFRWTWFKNVQIMKHKMGINWADRSANDRSFAYQLDISTIFVLCTDLTGQFR